MTAGADARGIILDGRRLATRIRQQIAADCAAFARRQGRTARVVVVRGGDDPASQVYVAAKGRAAREVGMTDALTLSDTVAPAVVEALAG